jgi:DNA repair exonuclease SbcCD ATPase subunit
VQKSDGTLAGQDMSALENKISRLQTLMDAFLEKFDMNSMVSSFQETLDETLDTFKESQDSFQKIMVNLNINNQKTISDKLEQLDRLNELVPMKDTVDEIAEQMDTFEAIMADINQLVDERLQLLQEIQSGLGSVGGTLPREIGGDTQTRILKKMEEIGSVVGMMKDKVSSEGIIGQMKILIERMGDDLKQNQEAAQKILVNLNVNSQKWSLERLDEINTNLDLVKEIKEQFSILETLIPSISEFMELKMRDLGDVTASLQKLETGKLLGDNLQRVQKAVEHETKALRQSIEASQKIMTTLANNNQKLVMEKLNSAGLSSKAIDDIARKNQDVLAAIIGQMDPGKTLSNSVDNLITTLDEIKNNMGAGFAIDKLEDFLGEQAERSRKSQDSVTRILTGLYETNHSLSMSKIDQLVSSLADLKSTLNPDALASTFGDMIIEGNEIIKENQGALMNLQMNHYKEIMDELKRIQALKGTVAGAASAGELVPVIESLMSNSFSNFRQDLDGAHKVLVNLNINLQKQMIAKIQEFLSQKDRNLEVKIDTDSLVNTMEYLLDEKLGDIKESQESLLSVNLSSQKTLLEKLDRVAKVQKGGESIADDLNSLLPLIEKIVADKLKDIVTSHQKAQTSLDNLNRDISSRVNQKLDSIIDEIKKSSALKEVDNYLPAIREALEDTFTYMSQLKGDIESLKDNIKLQDPEFFGKKFEEIKKFLASPGEVLQSIPRLEQILQKSLKDQKEAMDTIGSKLEFLYNAIKSVSDDKGDSASTMRIQQLFSKKLEETRELERQLVRSFQEMQDVFSQNYSGSGEENIQAILQNLEDTRSDQEKLSLRIEQLSAIMRQVSAGKGDSNQPPAAEAAAVEQMKNENSRLRQAVEKLRRENMDLGNQLKTASAVAPAKGGTETRRLDQLQAVMLEKDRLLEECYRDKVDLRDQLEKERRDKYEIIQKYETEKKELIDSLALERIQREKDRAELELLRAESRKKKWW